MGVYYKATCWTPQSLHAAFLCKRTLYIKSRVMQAAFEEAYRNQIITGKYPSGAIFLTIPLHLVDVNVHPAKTRSQVCTGKSSLY